MLSGCASAIPSVDGCLEFRPITPTADDWKSLSRSLARQIIDHDARYDRLCAKEPVK